MNQTLQQLCEEFQRTVIATYTWYLDSFKGLELMRDQMEKRQKETGFDDSALIPYLKHDEGNPNLTGLVQTTVGEFKKRNAADGPNFELLANVFIVAIYSWWEDHYRGRFADYLKRGRDEIKIPIMGDIRWLRHGIIHANGVATDDIDKCEILRWFKPKDRIVITFERAETIGVEIKKGIEAFYREAMIIR